MRRLVILPLALAALGCGSKHAGPPPGDSFTERRSFDVVAKLIVPPGTSFASNMPTRIPFTLVLEPGAGRVIGGGGGKATVVALANDVPGVFHSSPRFEVGFSLSKCSGVVAARFTLMDVTVHGDQLTGQAEGELKFETGHGSNWEPIQADLTGTRDTTPPFLILPTGVTSADPLAPFQLWTSEPLPDSALARLVGRDGAVAGLVPEVIDGEVPLIASFAKPNFTMPPGAGFEAMYSDDVVDLAGNVARLGDALRLPEVSSAPLMMPDGFELVAGDALGGASIVRGQPDVTIAGGASAYLSPPGAPWIPNLTVSNAFVVRMAVPPGATKLALSYRELLQPAGVAAPAAIQLGSVGRAPGMATPLPAPATFRGLVWHALPVQVSDVATLEMPLPDAVGPELVVVIRSAEGCDNPPGVPGLMLDDLRLE